MYKDQIISYHLVSETTKISKPFGLETVGENVTGGGNFCVNVVEFIREYGAGEFYFKVDYKIKDDTNNASTGSFNSLTFTIPCASNAKKTLEGMR